jgi:hypothetical protein
MLLQSHCTFLVKHLQASFQVNITRIFNITFFPKYSTASSGLLNLNWYILPKACLESYSLHTFLIKLFSMFFYWILKPNQDVGRMSHTHYWKRLTPYDVYKYMLCIVFLFSLLMTSGRLHAAVSSSPYWWPVVGYRRGISGSIVIPLLMTCGGLHTRYLGQYRHPPIDDLWWATYEVSLAVSSSPYWRPVVVYIWGISGSIVISLLITCGDLQYIRGISGSIVIPLMTTCGKLHTRYLWQYHHPPIDDLWWATYEVSRAVSSSPYWWPVVGYIW